MKKQITIFLTTVLMFCAQSYAQKIDPSPYCKAEFNHNYNMFETISIGAFYYDFGPRGNVDTTNSYLYIDTAVIPPISTTLSSSLLVDFYSTIDTTPSYFAIWIDYNQNKKFDDTEVIMTNQTLLKSKLPSGTASKISLPLSLKAPKWAKPGKTRMRILRTEKISDPSGPYDPTFVPNPCNDAAASVNVHGCAYDFDVLVYNIDYIDEKELLSKIIISPNPANNQIQITNHSTEKIKEVKIFDLLGKEVYKNTEDFKSINISYLQNGIYMIQLTTSQDLKLRYKVLKQE